MQSPAPTISCGRSLRESFESFPVISTRSTWSTFQELIGYPQADDDPYVAKAKHIAFLPIVHGGFGLSSMALIAPAAYWAAWADIFPTIAERRPAWTQQFLAEFENPNMQLHCVAQVRQASEAIPVEHFRFKPDWRRIAAGERQLELPEELRGEPGIWPHGWQFYASSAIITQH